MILVNPNVGVAPGTTTMTVGGLSTKATFGEAACAPDPVRQYTSPLAVKTNLDFASDWATPTVYYPYVDTERLRGLGSLGIASPPRWGLVLIAGLATFAAVLFLRRRRH